MKKALSLLLLFSLAVSPAEAGVYKSYVGKKINSSHVKKSSSTSRILKAGYGPTATFLKDYRRGRSIDADYAVGSKTGTITVTRNSGSPGTYVDDSGFVQNMPATNNTARFTSGFYSTSGFVSYPGILMEGASTNLLKDSYFADGTTTYWTAGGTGAFVASTDFTNVYLGGQVLKFTGSANADRVFSATAFATSSSTTYTVSAILRGSGNVVLRFYNGDSGSQDSTTIALTNSWRLYQASFANTGAGSNSRFGLVQTGAGSVTAYLATVQCEALPFASSFIPTTTAALTRNAESLSYPFSGNCNLVNSTGTILIKGTYLVDSTSASGFFFSRGTLNSRMYVQGGGGHPKCTAGDGDTSAASYTNVQGASLVQGFTFNGTNAIQYINGTADGVRNGYATSGLTNSQFFLGWNASSAATSVIISSIAIFSDANGSGDVANITNLINGNI